MWSSSRKDVCQRAPYGLFERSVTVTVTDILVLPKPFVSFVTVRRKTLGECYVSTTLHNGRIPYRPSMTTKTNVPFPFLRPLSTRDLDRLNLLNRTVPDSR